MRKLTTLALVMALVLSGLALAACDGKGEEGSASSSEETTAKKPDKGGSAFDDIPIYPGAKKVQKAEGTPAKGMFDSREYANVEHRAYETGDSPDKVADFYKKQMPKNGWTKLVFQKYPEGSYMGAWVKGGKGTGAQISISDRKGSTYIGIIRGEGE